MDQTIRENLSEKSEDIEKKFFENRRRELSDNILYYFNQISSMVPISNNFLESSLGKLKSQERINEAYSSSFFFVELIFW